MQPETEKVLWHQSGVSPKGDPFVQLLLDEKIIAQMSPEQARDHARTVMEAAEAAEQDAFIFEWAQRKVGVGLEQAMALIVDFRKYRAERTGKSQGPTRPTDWVMPPADKRPDYGEFGKRQKERKDE